MRQSVSSIARERMPPIGYTRLRDQGLVRLAEQPRDVGLGGNVVRVLDDEMRHGCSSAAVAGQGSGKIAFSCPVPELGK